MNMTTLRLTEVVRKLRRRLARDECAVATDAALLERFRACRDEEAFAELVRRHGPMVLGVCRRLLRNADDADDAFQATFLVLVRRGSAVRQLGSVGSWLYGVARRTALEARRSAARRRVKEAGAMRGSAVAGDPCDDLREALDEEIERLPEKYRAPLVLCDLEGKTRKEAARQLGWPEGTVASRLALARKTLGGRLSRRGLALPGGVVALATSGEAAPAAVPPALVGSTVQVAAGRTIVSSGVAALVKGVLTTMLLKKLKTGLVIALVVGVVGAGGNIFRGALATEARAADESKARSPIDELRHENELLKLNLHVLLEKVHAQESELIALKSKADATIHARDGTKISTQDLQLHVRAPVQVQLPAVHADGQAVLMLDALGNVAVDKTAPKIQKDVTVQFLGDLKDGAKANVHEVIILADPVQRAEAALKGLREAKDEKSRQRAVRELEASLAIMKAHHGIRLDQGTKDKSQDQGTKD
jgi:RNA polymerase sigma factor (sigma-70 family)